MRYRIIRIFVFWYIETMEKWNKRTEVITIYFRYSYVIFWGIVIEGYILLFSDKIYHDPLDDDDEELGNDDEAMDTVSKYEIAYSPFIKNNYLDEKVARYFYKNRLSYFILADSIHSFIIIV